MGLAGVSKVRILRLESPSTKSKAPRLSVDVTGLAVFYQEQTQAISLFPYLAQATTATPGLHPGGSGHGLIDTSPSTLYSVLLFAASPIAMFQR